MSCSNRTFLSISLLAVVIALLFTSNAAAQNWKPMPIRNQLQYDAGIIGGEAEQHMHGIARSVSNPDVIYLSHDCGQVWRSVDNGESWVRAKCKGMYVIGGQSIEVDPVHANVVIAIIDASYSYTAENYEGIYRSTDFGENWQLVKQVDGDAQRMYQHNIAYDPTSIDANGAARWYAATPNSLLMISEDYGQTWTAKSSLASHDNVYALYCKPQTSDTIYLATSQGLFKSTNKGTTLTPIGNLPAGDVSSIAVRQDQPETIFVVMLDEGTYKSTDGGTTFVKLRGGMPARVFINSGFPDWVYVTYTGYDAEISEDAGATWRGTVTHPPLGESGTWNSSFRGQMAGISPDTRNTQVIHAYGNAALWKSTDGGQNFYDGSTLFLGHAWGWWNDSIAYDVQDPNRWIQFCADIGLDMTANGAQWFSRSQVPYSWYTGGLVSWRGMHAGDIYPSPNSPIIIGSVGMYFDTVITRSADNGVSWSIVDSNSENHLFIAFNTDNPNIVYAGNKRSTNAGLTFTSIPFLDSNSASILGMSLSQPNTIYALKKPRNEIYRSDDAGVTWSTYASVGWYFNRHDSKPTFTTDPADPDVIYTLDSSGDLARFDGTTWTSLGALSSIPTAPYTNFVRHVQVDPSNSDIIYVSMFVPGIADVLRSTDRGQTWEDISNNMPLLGSQGISVNPHTGDLMASSCCGTRIFPPPYESPNSIYDSLSSYQEIQGRYVFYNNSAFDNNNPAINDDDYNAIATDKTALLPGQTTSFSNYTSYTKGINGVIIDFESLDTALTAADFEFNAGNNSLPDGWGNAPAPTNIVNVQNFGPEQVDRVIITFADNAIRKQWLKVTVKANENTGLSAPDIFYFGNAVGETGDTPGDTTVDATDEISARNNPRNFMRPATIDDVNDHNRDGKVDATDQITSRNHITTIFTELRIFTAP